jgi:hypothetical protein
VKEVVLWNCAVALLAWMFGFQAIAADCPVPNRNLYPQEYLTDNYRGRLAWLPFGPNSDRYYVLDGCNTLYIGQKQTLYFTVNAIFSPNGGDGTASYVAVQVAKLQKGEQQYVDVAIERNDKWCRDVTSSGSCQDNIRQDGFRMKTITGLTPRGFFDLHTQVPFNDQALKFRDLWWHGTPVGGTSSSRDQPPRFNWPLDIISLNPKRVQLSNRLYGFAFGATDVPFEVGIRGTESTVIRVMSPAWPDDTAEYTLNLVPR